MLFPAPLANSMTLPTYTHLPAGLLSLSLCLSCSISGWWNLPCRIHQILLLAGCHLLPHLSVGQRVSPALEDPPWHRSRFCPVPSLCQVTQSPLLFKTWQPSPACNQRGFGPSNSWVKYQAVIWLVQTLLGLDGLLFGMWLMRQSPEM